MVDQDKIVEMAVNRTAPMMIAYKLQCDAGTVYNAIRQARKKGVVIPPFGKGRTPKEQPQQQPLVQQVVVPTRLHRLLVQQAEKKEMTVQELGQRLIENGLLGMEQIDV